MVTSDAPKLELDSASALTDLRWLLGSDEEDVIGEARARVDPPPHAGPSSSGLGDGDDASAAHPASKAGATRKRHGASDDGSASKTAKSKKGGQPAPAPAPKPAAAVELDELVLEPGDALKLKVVVEAMAPALLHLRKSVRQVPFRDLVPRDPALQSPSSIVPDLTEHDEASVAAHQALLKQSWPAPERLERLKSVAIVQLPRDLETEADHADGIDSDSFATLADALDAALSSNADTERNGEAKADESREEEDFVRLRNVIFLVSSIHRRFSRLLRNPSGPSGFLQPDQNGRNLPVPRHQEFRIVSQTAAAKNEEESANVLVPNGTHASPKGGAAAAVSAAKTAPMTLTRAETALTTLWTQAWFLEILQGSTLVLALLNELAQSKRRLQIAEGHLDGDALFSFHASKTDDDGTRRRKRARHYLNPPKVAMHMNLGVFGDYFTNAADMPRKFWERQRAAAVGQFAAEGEEPDGLTSDDDDGHDSDNDQGGVASRIRRRAGVNRNRTGAASSAGGHGGSDGGQAGSKRSKPKSSGKGMGKGWRKGRTKAMEEFEEVNREEERRRDRWAAGELDFGPASIVAITSFQDTDRASGVSRQIPTLGERLRAKGPAADLSKLAETRPAFEDAAPLTYASPGIPLHKRFPGRLADFLYYNQYSSFAPAYDTSRSTGSGQGTATIWWTARQDQNRMKRVRDEGLRSAYQLPEDLEKAFGGVPQPPSLFAGQEQAPIQDPETLLDDGQVKEALAAVQEIKLGADTDLVLDPDLLQRAYETRPDRSLMDTDDDEVEAQDHGETTGASGVDGDQVDDPEALAERVLSQNQTLLQALAALQGQRLLAQVRQAEASNKAPQTFQEWSWQPSPVERLIASELLSSLGAIVSLRPRSSIPTSAVPTTLIPSASVLRALSASAAVAQPDSEPAFWGTIAQAQYTNPLPVLYIDQLHQESGRKGPLVIKDNTAVQLSDPAPSAVLLQQHMPGHGMGGMPTPGGGVPPAFSPSTGAGPPLDAYGRPQVPMYPGAGPYPVTHHAQPVQQGHPGLYGGMPQHHLHASARGSPLRTFTGGPGTGPGPGGSPFNSPMGGYPGPSSGMYAQHGPHRPQ